MTTLKKIPESLEKQKIDKDKIINEIIIFFEVLLVWTIVGIVGFFLLGFIYKIEFFSEHDTLTFILFVFICSAFSGLLTYFFMIIVNKYPYRSGFTFKRYDVDESSLEYQMKTALFIADEDECYKRVEELLKQGADPNKMAGQLKWIDTNPLWRVEGDKRLVELFLHYGADVKNRPYIANVVSCRILADKNPRKGWLDFHNEHPDVFIYNEAEVFDTVKLLLEHGADVNMKTGANKILFPDTDWNYKRYFNKYGKSAINYCIEENYLLLFPLLIEYGAKLDEKSLQLATETTERTGSTEMEDLVKKQWAIQHKD